MNEQSILDLSMKVLGQQCPDAERAEFDAMLVRQPDLKQEFERLQAEVGFDKEILPLISATESATGQLRGQRPTKRWFLSKNGNQRLFSSFPKKARQWHGRMNGPDRSNSRL
jgi:hypothetical protein